MIAAKANILIQSTRTPSDPFRGQYFLWFQTADSCQHSDVKGTFECLATKQETDTEWGRFLSTNLSSYTVDFPMLSNPSVSRKKTEVWTPSISISKGSPQTHIPANQWSFQKSTSLIVRALKSRERNWPIMWVAIIWLALTSRLRVSHMSNPKTWKSENVAKRKGCEILWSCSYAILLGYQDDNAAFLFNYT